MPKSTRQRWRRWLKIIEGDVLTLHWNRAIHRRVREIVQDNPSINYDNPLHEWIQSNYVAANVLRLRRLIDAPSKKNPNLSILVLLADIEAAPGAISQRNLQRFFRYYGSKDKSALLVSTSDGGFRVDSVKVGAEVAKLKRKVRKVKTFADRYIAHHDRKRGKPPKLEDVDAAIDAAGELFNEISILLTGRSFGSLEPSDEAGWDQILEEPWIRIKEDPCE